MNRTTIILLVMLSLGASVLTITNANLANAQQTFSSPSTQTQSGDAYTFGEALGTALGVRDGAYAGAQDDVAGLAASPSYIAPSPGEICRIYEDFYTEEGYVCSENQHYYDFSNGYMSGNRLGYIQGYSAGYYLEATNLGSLLQPSTTTGGI